MTVVIKVTAQVSFLGFDQPICVSSMTNTYTYTNYSFGSHGYGFDVYRNGTLIYGENNGGLNGPSGCVELKFINDSVGFMVKYSPSGGTNVMKTNNYGMNWVIVGGGPPRDSHGLYIINKNHGYLVTVYGGSVWVNKFSDLAIAYNIILDYNVNTDIYRMDTTLNHSMCNIDSLNIFIKNGLDTITYHINSMMPIITQSVTEKNCAGNAIAVPFDLGTTFNPGNNFIAQLSDASGSFASPVNIGSLASTVAGTINAIIPSLTSASSNYKIRIVSSNPAYTGTDNGAWITVVNNLPLVSITSSCTDSIICIGSSVNLLASGSVATYTWSSGSTSAINNVTATTSMIYSVQAENVCGISTATINVIVDSTCSYVKPGDVDADGIVSNLDVLELGLHFNQAGPPRSFVSNNWQSYYASLWNNTITNGKNLNNSDCNGDGIINSADTLAIFNNYNYIYSPTSNHPNPDLKIVPVQSSIMLDTWSSASIYLGDSTNMISNINGLAFSVSFMNSIDSIYLEYSTSFLNNTNQNLNFSKIFPAPNGIVYAATTHTNNFNVNGFGKIGTLYFRTSSTKMSPNQYITFWLKDVYKSNSAGQLTHLKQGACSIWVTDFVGVKEIEKNISVSLSPNPTNNLLTVNSSEEMQKIELSNITGQVLLFQQSTNKIEEIQLQNFSNGVYFVKITLPDGRNTTKKIVVNH